ncbi:MAG TPA: hypothetical protein VN651_14150 [Gemmatimonadaceae bacterium]|nr:hypothetical protein [Gemmatimonadaceae bacterium]
MHLTLWSRDSLLGELELAEPSGRPPIRVGPFRPTDAMQAILPLFATANAAVMAIGPMLERRGMTREPLGAELGQAVYDALRDSPEGQHVSQTRAVLDALALDLRDASGASVPYDYVTIQPAWGSDSTVAASADARARLEAAGYSQYLAAVALSESSLPMLESSGG